ncbi:MAG: hypothetical protein KC729_07925, partial [Candidatus Eisenbacteria bacterium]|nr:hypothetical protein [Candidatus Eisenbacteria bacterium]
AVDGVSLTIGVVTDLPEGTRFRVHIIPETLTRTRFGSYREGDRVNLEVDILAKYMLRAAAFASRTQAIDPDRSTETTRQS